MRYICGFLISVILTANGRWNFYFFITIMLLECFPSISYMCHKCTWLFFLMSSILTSFVFFQLYSFSLRYNFQKKKRKKKRKQRKINIKKKQFTLDTFRVYRLLKEKKTPTFRIPVNVPTVFSYFGGWGDKLILHATALNYIHLLFSLPPILRGICSVLSNHLPRCYVTSYGI